MTAIEPWNPHIDILAQNLPSLYLPTHPLNWALDRVDTALHDMRAASVTGWRSVLARTYRNELDDLIEDVGRVRAEVLSARQQYDHLRYVAE